MSTTSSLYSSIVGYFYSDKDVLWKLTKGCTYSSASAKLYLHGDYYPSRTITKEKDQSTTSSTVKKLLVKILRS